MVWEWRSHAVWKTETRKTALPLVNHLCCSGDRILNGCYLEGMRSSVWPLQQARPVSVGASALG